MKCYGDARAALHAANRAASVPAYRAAWTAAGIEPPLEQPDDLARLPYISKDDLIAGVAGDPPWGRRLACEESQIASVFVLPGPLYLPLTAGDLDRMFSAQAAAFRSCGLRRGDLVDNTVSYHWVLGGALIDGGLRRAGCVVLPGGPGNSELHLDTIVALRADAIVAFPTFLDQLLRMAAERGVGLPLRRASISGELHRSDFKQVCLEHHGIVVRERYGVSEVGSVAYECAAGAGLHVRDDLLVEAVDPVTGEALELESTVVKELVVTDPGREALPIVRLRTGDLVGALELEACECGRSAPRVMRIIGRTSSIPRVKGTFVVPRVVAEVLERNGAPGRHQLRIERPTGQDRLTIVVERPSPAHELDVAVIQAALSSALRIRVEVEQTELLPSDAPVVDDRRVIT
jgi:phenylacetate-CoA ligase